MAVEWPVAVTLYCCVPGPARRAGGQVDWIALAPTIAGTDAVGVVASAPHPHAAVLFYDFMLGDGQAMMAEMHHLISHRRMAPELRRFKLKFIDPAAVFDDYDRRTRIFEDTIHRRK